MNEQQVALKEAMGNADTLTEDRGRMAQSPIAFSILSMQRYLADSIKWVSVARGWMTIDGTWVVTRMGAGQMMIGRNY